MNKQRRERIGQLKIKMNLIKNELNEASNELSSKSSSKASYKILYVLTTLKSFFFSFIIEPPYNNIILQKLHL